MINPQRILPTKERLTKAEALEVVEAYVGDQGDTGKGERAVVTKVGQGPVDVLESRRKLTDGQITAWRYVEALWMRTGIRRPITGRYDGMTGGKGGGLNYSEKQLTAQAEWIKLREDLRDVDITGRKSWLLINLVQSEWPTLPDVGHAITGKADGASNGSVAHDNIVELLEALARLRGY